MIKIVYLSFYYDFCALTNSNLKKNEIKIQMDFYAIDSVVYAVFFCTRKNCFRGCFR